ncbi:DUF4062 domain-containing protein [Clostridium perfringens]|nr:DUF4062 domain-containing protein [Clostridium perfringens]MDK0664786.1 DUF4062 domain-containing protein [Clostridium perfringens]
MEKRYQIFISSTFADLQEERKEIMEAIMNLNCFPAGMEMFPANDSEQFEYIKKIIDESDYYILVIAGRYGSLADDGKSYTEKEFDYAKEKGIPVLVFVKKDFGNIPSNKTDKNEEKRQKLESFIEEAMKGRLAKYWENSKDLKYEVHNSLSQAFKTHPRVGWVRGNVFKNEELFSEIKDLKTKNIELENQVNAYRKEKEEYESENAIDKNTLASGKDEYRIEYSYIVNEEDNLGWPIEKTYKASTNLTWDQITLFILQIIDRKEISSNLMKSEFENILNKTFIHKIRIAISDIQFKKIIIQLEVLGFIKEENNYFKSTKKGDLKYINWLLVKNK